MDSPLATDGGLPAAYIDPQEYLLQARFHHSLKYQPDHLTLDDKPLRVTYALLGADQNPDAPCVVWINGLGGGRLSGQLLGCASHVQLGLGSERLGRTRRADALGV